MNSRILSRMEIHALVISLVLQPADSPWTKDEK